MNLSMNDIFPWIAAFVALVAWSVRLEMKVFRNTEQIESNDKALREKIRDTEDALREGDNRMNAIDGRVVNVLNVMNSKLDIVNESVNEKFNQTSKSVAKIEGMLMYKDKMDHPNA